MPPRCWLAQSDGAHDGLTSPPSMRKFQRVSNLPASPSRWTLVQYGTGPHVRFGSKADICSAQEHVRFTPNSDRKSGLPQKLMSALPPKADMCSALDHVCYGPKADIGYLFDHFVGAGEQRWRHGKTERLGSLGVDH